MVEADEGTIIPVMRTTEAAVTILGHRLHVVADLVSPD